MHVQHNLQRRVPSAGTSSQPSAHMKVPTSPSAASMPMDGLPVATATRRCWSVVAAGRGTWWDLVEIGAGEQHACVQSSDVRRTDAMLVDRNASEPHSQTLRSSSARPPKTTGHSSVHAVDERAGRHRRHVVRLRAVLNAAALSLCGRAWCRTWCTHCRPTTVHGVEHVGVQYARGVVDKVPGAQRPTLTLLPGGCRCADWCAV